MEAGDSEEGLANEVSPRALKECSRRSRGPASLRIQSGPRSLARVPRRQRGICIETRHEIYDTPLGYILIRH
jgi:hypothetical protein